MNRFQTTTLGLLSLLGILSQSGRLLAQSVRPDSVRQRVILIGDAGRLRQGKNPVVDAVAARYSLNDPATTLVYLGDNIYPRGLPDPASPDYAEMAQILRYQAAPALGRQSSVVFIPGNHDWTQGKPDGWDRIRRQGRLLDSLQSPNIRLLPANGCPDPMVVSLGNDLILIALDTQWWLHPYDKPGETSDCDCKTPDAVTTRLTDLAARYKDKGIIVAAHHPFRSYGIHGGYYTLKQHLFPLTEFSPNLYVPLPVIGSIYPLMRGVFGNIQDLANPAYKRMARAIEQAVAQAPNLVFVSGHDHALQHIVEGNRSFIVSGSGINRERVKAGKLARFVSSDWGYVVLDELTDGRLTATFYTVDEQASATRAYSAPIFTSRPTPDAQTGQTTRPAWPDSMRMAVAPDYDSVGTLHRLLLGTNYRRAWATPVTLPVFDISRTQGGFRVLQRGGGMQTKSLRLADASGHEWVLRTIQKDPTSALPPNLRETIARPVLQDEISASHPFSALAVPPLAQAAGVPHANPRVVYVPDDLALDTYRADFAQTVCLLEERNPGDGKSISTPKLLDALEDDNDNQVDERALLRARMLDLLIGDWDRHEDQWRWCSRKTATGNVYYPIPRDRDQVFFRANGLFPTIAAAPWLQPKLQGFRAELANVDGFMYNARFLDRLFLPGLNAQDWVEEITALQAAWTDAVLARAIDRLPAPIRQQAGPQLLALLKTRRGWLRQEGLTYYRFLARAVDIPGSDKTELFRVEHRANGQVAVSVFKITKRGERAQRLYYRVFDPAVTHEIRLYGRGGNDQFEVINAPSANAGRPDPSRLVVRLIGGAGNDRFTVAEGVAKPRIYDLSTEANELPPAGRASLHTAPDPAVNRYDPHAFRYDRLAPLASVGYNLDDGLLLGVGAQWTHHGFRKDPYASMQRLLVRRALATKAVSIRYDGQFTHLIGQNDLWLSAVVKAPDNVTNFFGTGNETVYDKSRGIRYYRTRYNLITLTPLLRRRLSNQFDLTAGPVFQHFRLDGDENDGRFIQQYVGQLPNPATFLTQENYAGLQLGFQLDTRDNSALPTRGVLWHTTLLGLQGFSDQPNHLTQLRTDFTLTNRVGRGGRLLLTNRLGGGLTYGKPAFYQLLYLGGHDNLRGFRNYRFAGNHAFYHNIEARLKLFDFSSYLFPGSVGLLAFNDLGRVWLRGESSARWHAGYGGGLYVTPASLLVLTASVGVSPDGVLPYIALGVRL